MTIEFQEQYMLEALSLAEKAALEDEVPVGAVVIKDGVIIGRGHNRRESEQSPIAHAEILAIQEAARHLGTWRLTDCLLVVTLEPCPMCLGASQQARIEALMYGAQDPKGGAISLGYLLNEDSRTHHRFKATYVEFPKCGKILSNFFERKRKM